ncbi:MAG: hybrid sensor histidine kinase/response regulator [Desulfobacterales bacterium]|nr:hybrid sensor histidine kinase/response regulator [Desulfobacterales bacterium]MCP4159911.1 hybrid sensor histidine kinase/response regulator [Deltaproteobacteria bacterium]
MSDKQRVLVVDDAQANIKVLNELLRNQYHISVATNGPDALDIANSKNKPDIILLDIMMPGIDGYEVCKQIKANSKISHIPIIFITAKTETEDIVKGFKMGAIDYILKPFNSEEFLARIDTHLQLKKAKEKIEMDSVEIKNLNSNIQKINRELIGLNTSLEEKVKQRTLELSDANKRLAYLNDEKMVFLKYLSHEMNTPLNFISAANIINKDDMSEDNLEIVEMIKMGFSRLNDFIKEVIGYFDLGQIVCKKVNVSLEEVIKEVKSTVDTKSITLELLLKEQIRVNADKTYLTQLISILIENAIVFSRPNGHVLIETSTINDKPVLIITDKGKGIKRENLEAVFIPFVIQDFERHDGGYGLNLPKAKVIATSHNWSLYAESDGIDKGSRFTVVFK